MKIEQLDIYEHEGIMYLSFACVNEAGQYIEKHVIDELSRLNINKETHGWYDIDTHFDMRWNEKNNKIEIKEKNNRPGPYGQTSILLLFPAFLMDKGFISAEHMVELEKIIKNSDLVKERNSTIVTPSYMTHQYPKR